jgi:hypothetical protein
MKTPPERARELQTQLDAHLKNPGALLLPAPVRQWIRDVAALLVTLADGK